MRLGTDSRSADENDYVNSACSEKENSSSKTYEMSKWSFGHGILVTDWNATLHFINIEIPDDAQINDEPYTFSNFFNQGTNL